MIEQVVCLPSVLFPIVDFSENTSPSVEMKETTFNNYETMKNIKTI